MPKSAKQYFEELCAEAGYSPEETAALVKVATNDKVAPKIEGLLKTADDYNAQVGRVRAAEDKVQKYDQWYGTATAEYQQAFQQLEAEKKRLGVMDNTNGNGAHQIDTTQFITKADLEARLQDQGGRFASVIKDLTKVAGRHMHEFKEELDVDALEKMATENNLPIGIAYERMVKPRVEAREKEKLENAIKNAREEGARDALSRHKLPVDAVPQDTAPMYRTVDPKDVPKDMDADLLEAWHGVK